MNRKSLFKIITIVLLPLIFLGIVEAVLALVGVRTTFQDEDPFLGFKSVDPLFEKVTAPDRSAVYRTRRAKLQWFNDQEFKAVKPKNGYRVFCFGGSTTFGRPYAYNTAFSGWLQLILSHMDPSKEYEVINVGGVSYASYRVVNLMKEMATYEPDLFIVYSGHNEFLEERTYGNIAGQSAFVTAVRSGLNHLRTYSVARRMWLGVQGSKAEEARKKFLMTGEVRAILDQSSGLDQYHRDTLKAQSIFHHFRVNLGRMADLAAASGAKLIFIVPPSNEKDFSPFKSELFASLNPGRLRQWDEFYANGRAELARGNYQAALSLLEYASSIDSGYADLRYRIGHCLLGLGRYTEARHAFDEAMNLDVAPLRATSMIQQIVRDAGRERAIPTIDLKAILDDSAQARLGYPILGKEFFLDHAHPTIPVHELVARELASTMVMDRMVSPALQVGDLNLPALYDSVIATLHPAYFALRDMNLAKVLDWAGKKEEAVPFILRAAENLPTDPEAHFYLGKMYEEQGRLRQAAEAFQKAIELDSLYANAYNALGTVYDRANMFDEAILNFRLATDVDTTHVLAYYNLGRTLTKVGRVDEALRAFRNALLLDPDQVNVLDNMGTIYIMTGQLDSAVAALTRVVAEDPRNIRACNSLGVACFQQGDLHGARTAFETVLRLRSNDAFAAQWLRRVQALAQ